MHIRNWLRAHTSSLLLGALCTPLVFAQTEESDGPSVLDNIVVVGTHIDLNEATAEVAFTPGGVELIDLDKFREQNVSSMADVLRLSPGIWAASTSGDDNVFFSSRGSNLDSTNYDQNGIKLLQDGLPVTTAGTEWPTCIE